MSTIVKNSEKKAVTTTTKVVNQGSKKVVIEATKSKKQIEIEARVLVLQTKEASQGLTKQENVYLANAEEKLESKKISRVYRDLQLKIKAKDASVLRILGSSKFPTFKEWSEKMPIKAQYSYYDGLLCLAKFNKQAVTKSKVERQNKTVAAK